MLTTIIIFIIVLAALILVHEFGHFITAKKSGIRVDEFGLGFPPRIWGYKYGETTYSINWIPFGGFVRIHGENSEDVHEDDPDRGRSLIAKNRGIQALVMAAGVLMNAVFAWLLISIGLMIGLPYAMDGEAPAPIQDAELTLTRVLPGSPASEAGLKAGDRILSVAGVEDGEEVSGPDGDTFSDFIAARGGEELVIDYKRGDEELSSTVSPETGILEDPSRAAIGVTMGMIGTLKLPQHRALWHGLGMTASLTERTAVALGGFFKRVVSGSADFEQVAGPVGIVNLVGDATELGVVYLLQFTAVISINLAIINLIPFPALDGGRLLFVAIESVSRRPINPKAAGIMNTVGFALLILLMLVVTYHDIAKLL